MARFVVPVVVLVALVGGYVVGQQPDRKDPQPPNAIGLQRVPGSTQAAPESEPEVLFTTVELRTGPVGRYVPFGVGLMLDTTNGTLYAQYGNPTRWKAVTGFGDTPRQQ